MENNFKKYLIDLHRRKDLLLYLVISGLKAQHRNTFLGYTWWLLDPLLGVAIYYFVVVVVFHRGGEDYGIFLVIGMVVWRWFSAAITSASLSIVTQAGIITQVYLPKIIFPLGATLTQLINFGFGFVIIALFLFIFELPFSLAFVWIPYIILMQLFFSMAIALVFSYISVFIRDANELLGHLLRIWFFGSPVIWQPEMLGEQASWIMKYNPMAHFLGAYRDVLMYQSNPDYGTLCVIGVLSAFIVMYVTYYFSQHEYKIIKAL